jgi:hypothetical protein
MLTTIEPQSLEQVDNPLQSPLKPINPDQIDPYESIVGRIAGKAKHAAFAQCKKATRFRESLWRPDL